MKSKMESFLRKHNSQCKKLVGQRAQVKYDYDLMFPTKSDRETDD